MKTKINVKKKKKTTVNKENKYKNCTRQSDVNTSISQLRLLEAASVTAFRQLSWYSYSGKEATSSFF